MHVCSDGHAEICHDNHINDCPFCNAISEHKDEVKDWDSSLRAAEQRIVELEAEIERLNEPFRSACREALGG